MARLKKAVTVAKNKPPKFEPQVYSQSVNFNKAIIDNLVAAADNKTQALSQEVTNTGLSTEEQLAQLRKERDIYCDKALTAEYALSRERRYHQLRVDEIDVFLEQINSIVE